MSEWVGDEKRERKMHGGRKDMRDCEPFALMNVEHSVLQRPPKKGEHVEADKERKELRKVARLTKQFRKEVKAQLCRCAETARLPKDGSMGTARWKKYKVRVGGM